MMIMKENESTLWLKQHGVKPTPNRILVVQALKREHRPVSLHEIEDSIVTIDKSSIFRVLGVFKAHGLVHVIEDGSDSVKYELCMSLHHDIDDDEHVHFYCESCHRTLCLEHLQVPRIDLPAGFVVKSENHIVKGTCPDCATQQLKNVFKN